MSEKITSTGYLGNVPLTPEETREVWQLQQGPYTPEAVARVEAIYAAALHRQNEERVR